MQTNMVDSTGVGPLDFLEQLYQDDWLNLECIFLLGLQELDIRRSQWIIARKYELRREGRPVVRRKSWTAERHIPRLRIKHLQNELLAVIIADYVRFRLQTKHQISRIRWAWRVLLR